MYSSPQVSPISFDVSKNICHKQNYHLTVVPATTCLLASTIKVNTWLFLDLLMLMYGTVLALREIWRMHNIVYECITCMCPSVLTDFSV